MRTALVLLIVAVAAFWPQLAGSEWRGTEARRVQIAWEMLQSGDWLVPTLGGERTFAKPPLHYWVLALCLQAFGLEPIAARLPALLGFWLLAGAVFLCLRDTHGRTTAWLAALGILCSPVVVEGVPNAEIDPPFAALTALSMLWLGRGMALHARGAVLGAGVLGGLALLSKGPPYFLFLAGAVLVWARRRAMWGWPWFVAPLLALPLVWLLPLLAFAADPERLADQAGEESVGRLFLFEWKHVVDTPLHLVRSFLVTLPFGLWVFYDRRPPGEATLTPPQTMLRVAVGAGLGAVLLLVLFPARPTRYLLPAVVLFVCALAPRVATWLERPTPLPQGARTVVRLVAVLAAIGIAASPWLPPPLPGRTVWLLVFFATAPLWITTRLALVVFVLLAPVVWAWTWLCDRNDLQAAPPRSYAAAAVALEREMLLLGVRDLATWGHVPSHVLLALEGGRPHVPPGDENRRRVPTAPWLLVEDGAASQALAGYRDRARVQLQDRTLVLKQRLAPADGR